MTLIERARRALLISNRDSVSQVITDLLAVVERLPVTADGVVVVPGMELHASFSKTYTEVVGQVTTRYGLGVLYSTREAAEAEKGGSDD